MQENFDSLKLELSSEFQPLLDQLDKLAANVRTAIEANDEIKLELGKLDALLSLCDELKVNLASSLKDKADLELKLGGLEAKLDACLKGGDFVVEFADSFTEIKGKLDVIGDNIETNKNLDLLAQIKAGIEVL